MSSKPARDRLLVIDDNDVFRATVTRIAEAVGYEVMTTDDPVAARAVIASWQPAVVAIDPLTRWTDGQQLLRQLGMEGCPARIVLTSHLDGATLNAGREISAQYGLKVSGILPKPFRPQTCRELLLEIKTATTVTSNELAVAITDNQLFLEYQPQLDCQFGRIRGVEALVRWAHPTRGVVAPNEFISLAERTPIIDELTDWVFLSAARQIALWREAALPLRLAVNVSARNFERADFPERLSAHCATCALETGLVTLEISEGDAMRVAPQIGNAMDELRNHGFGLSIDECGLGYSSLVQLRQMQFTELKIDKALVARMTGERDCRVMVEILIDLARKLELGSVAVGIEGETALNTVAAMGCGAAQGFHICRPLVGDRIPAAVAEWAAQQVRAVA